MTGTTPSSATLFLLEAATMISKTPLLVLSTLACVAVLGFAGRPAGEAALDSLERASVSDTVAPVLATATHLPMPAQVSNAPRAFGRQAQGLEVSGSVLDDNDRPVSGVTVVLYRGRERHVELTDDAGRYSFAGMIAGRYRAFIEERTLPAGLLPPYRQQPSRAYVAPPTGFFGTSFTVSANSPAAIDLRVFRAASVRGWVEDSAGQFVAGARVRLHGERGLQLEGKTDERGEFHIASAYPGTYSASVLGDGAGGSNAVARSFDLLEGEAHVLPVLSLSVGRNVLAQRRLESLEALRSRASAVQAETTAEGRDEGRDEARDEREDASEEDDDHDDDFEQDQAQRVASNLEINDPE